MNIHTVSRATYISGEALNGVTAHKDLAGGHGNMRERRGDKRACTVPGFYALIPRMPAIAKARPLRYPS
jgi:hypothetical protein